MREAVADASARESINLGERPQGNHVVVAVMHRIGIARSILRVLEVSFVQDNENALGYVPVKLVELML